MHNSVSAAVYVHTNYSCFNKPNYYYYYCCILEMGQSLFFAKCYFIFWLKVTKGHNYKPKMEPK